MKPVSLPLCQKMPRNSGTRTQQAMIPMLTATRGTICCGIDRRDGGDDQYCHPNHAGGRRTFRSEFLDSIAQDVRGEEVAVTSTMALIVDMAADMAASRMMPSKPWEDQCGDEWHQAVGFLRMELSARRSMLHRPGFPGRRCTLHRWRWRWVRKCPRSERPSCPGRRIS